ncbi:hypothetical protein SDC9_132755 [bioreactor metagenome]|uniref:Uncharacterized protein n=1 Tax=bioreactor metagenome TaxID=1076179 RepID=A0A645D8N9_9ZZZZ
MDGMTSRIPPNSRKRYISVPPRAARVKPVLARQTKRVLHTVYAVDVRFVRLHAVRRSHVVGEDQLHRPPLLGPRNLARTEVDFDIEPLLPVVTEVAEHVLLLLIHDFKLAVNQRRMFAPERDERLIRTPCGGFVLHLRVCVALVLIANADPGLVLGEAAVCSARPLHRRSGMVARAVEHGLERGLRGCACGNQLFVLIQALDVPQFADARKRNVHRPQFLPLIEKHRSARG